MRLLFGEGPEFVEVINSYEKGRLPLMWFVDNIEEIFLEFQNRGIQIVDSPKRRGYGLKEFSFIDINGYFIRVAESAENDEGITHY
jgi:hypothetical protein